jgi:aminoglycoside phosphotransferase family enzyme/predicted kinase
MITEDQTQVIDFLASGSTHGGAKVERIETHASIVFLAGERAWKLKRAVRYDYLDFSTVQRRKAMCEAEVRVNRRTAPHIYRGVVAVTRERDGSLALGGTGTPVEWLVEMARFDQEGLFDRLAAREALDLQLMPGLAAAIAQFHRAAQPRFDHGGRSGMARVIDGNAAGFAQEGDGILNPDSCRRGTSASRGALDRHARRLEARREAGLVRECHGDLHLRNIVLLEGRPTLFDAIEFNDDIACIDVLYDLAFLLMDLWRRRLPRHANAVLNGYLTETEDFEGVALLRLFLSCRAAVRAKTTATTAKLQSDPRRCGELQALSRDYLDMAARLLDPPRPCLVAIGGLSGSGKSRLALALAPSLGAVPGALVLRSDEIRKRLLGLSPLTRLGADGYAPEVSRRVYATVAERADAIVRNGHAAIADSVFARRADRDAIEQVAAAAGVPFVGLWLDAPESVLIERVRQRSGDPSDADAAVIRTQLSQDTGPIAWHRIDASAAAELVLDHATTLVSASD